MAQLKMKYRQPLPHKEHILPEGYTLCSLETEEDMLGWIQACDEGLGTGSWTIEDFYQNMLTQPGIEREQIFLVKNPQGKVVATATAWKRNHDQGCLHMVSALPESRGLGLSYLLCQKVLDFFLNQGIDDIMLDSDDFRLAALKVYLMLGFIPVLNDYDMADRWKKIFEQLQMTSPVYKVTFQEFQL